MRPPDPSARVGVPATQEVHLFFRLSSWELALLLIAIVMGTTVIGLLLGRFLHHRSEHLREPFGVLQAALLGLVGLVLAFGLSLAVGRYESRRTAVIDEANAIGTTYLRAQTLAEPMRTRSLELLKLYTDTSGLIQVPETPLVNLRESMVPPPAADAPPGP